ncbi:MAG TPA: heavy-metal-associated domain-containing protein [Acholeplasmataceae bacterium]|nr:heavy-metal-associated domain-containing protein [Acholeplasmataceae bacterium]
MTQTLKVTNMKCEHCAAAVKETLENVSGVESVLINLDEQTATVEHSEHVKTEDLVDALANEGYRVAK